MSNNNNVTKLYWSNYPNNPGVRLVYPSSNPNNPGVMHVGLESSSPNNSDVMHVHRSNYENNPGVQKIYLTGCFPETELVHAYFGTYVPIGFLKIGDKIMSWSVEKKKNQITIVSKIHKYTVNDIFCFNNTIRVSSSHPLMVVEKDENGMLIPKWKVAFDVNVGDFIVGDGGKTIAIKIKKRQWFDEGIEVLNLSTDNGVPFIVGNCIVRAENAENTIKWADTLLTKKLAA